MTNSKELLLENLKDIYGSLRNISKVTNVKESTIYNWSNNNSNPHLIHLETISMSLKINGSDLIAPNLKNRSNLVFNQTMSLNYYLSKNITNLMISQGIRRRDIVNYFNYNSTYITVDTFDDYRNGKILKIPLFRLDQLSLLFRCPAYKLIEVN